MAEYGEPLTERELEILELVATGVANREIAYRLGISTNTVKVHLRNIFVKMGAGSRTEASITAVREGLVAVPDAIGVDSARSVEPPPVPLSPVPLFRRATLVLSALIVVTVTVVSWPRPAETERAVDQPLPPLPNQAGDAQVLLSENSLWAERAQMPTRRTGLALVAVADRLYAIGGEGPEGATGVVEVYDTSADSWTRAAEKPTAAAYLSAGVLENHLIVPGGCLGEGEATAVVEVYDPSADVWSNAAALPTPLCAYALAVYRGQVFIFGGTDGQEAVRTTYVYDPAVGLWAEREPMLDARTVAAAAPLGDRIYVVGGYRDGEELRSCAVYNPAEDVWNECASLIAARSGLGLVGLGDRLYAIGGGFLGFNERYDARIGEWNAIETPITGLWQSPGVALQGTTIYAVGGWSRDFISLNMVFRPLPFQILVPATER